jgi:2-polyprenyl-3-methyl-5-hydroxy-6-metoxy-1,4-benzoquinol methylase
MDSEFQTACPICNCKVDIVTTKESYGRIWTIRRCLDCGHGFVEDRPTHGFLSEIYSNDSSHHAMSDTHSRLKKPSRVHDRTTAKICSLTRGRGFSLDIGSGSAIRSLSLHKHGFSPVMIDLDPRARRAANRVPNGIFQYCSFEDFMCDKPFSVILMSHVLEHALYPIQWLDRARQMLSQQGVLAVLLPNFTGVYRLLGSHDPFLLPPVHLNFFSPRSLKLAFQMAGLRPVAFETRSYVPTQHQIRKFSMFRKVMGHAWNLLSKPLDFTPWGIILHGYAKQP